MDIPPITEHIAEAIVDDKKIIDLSKSKSLTYEETNNYLKELNLNPNTLHKYLQDFKRLIALTGCENILGCLKKPKEMISKIKNGKKADGEPYSINTQKSLFQTMLFLITRLNLKVTDNVKKQYLHVFEVYKVKTFGKNSKMYVLSRLYQDVTVRDFVLKIVSALKEADDVKENYIIIPRAGILTVIINNYKTAKKYDVQI